MTKPGKHGGFKDPTHVVVQSGFHGDMEIAAFIFEDDARAFVRMLSDRYPNVLFKLLNPSREEIK